jgi:hypothetical protein
MSESLRGTGEDYNVVTYTYRERLCCEDKSTRFQPTGFDSFRGFIGAEEVPWPKDDPPVIPEVIDCRCGAEAFLQEESFTHIIERDCPVHHKGGHVVHIVKVRYMCELASVIDPNEVTGDAPTAIKKTKRICPMEVLK